MKAFLIAVLAMTAMACSKVPAGNVGVKVYLLGKEKGVDSEVLPVGRYWIGINEDLYLFPTFEQNYTWANNGEGRNDESITFQDRDGTTINTDVGISYHINPEKVHNVFQKYRRGVDEITDVFLRNQVRDAFNKAASKMSVDEIYGARKEEFMDSIQKTVADEVHPIGIEITKLYITGSFRLPPVVLAALNSKIESTQRAIQRENELREAEAQAKKEIAKADGEGKAILAKAEAQAKANRIISDSITATLVEYNKWNRWDGKMPTVTGSAGTLMNMKE